MSDSLTSGQALKAIGATRNTLLKWENALGFEPPRVNGNRQFPQELVANLTAFGQLLNALDDMPPGEYLMWEQRLGLQIPRDAWGMRDFSDAYWVDYLTTLHGQMREATIDLDELQRWEWELHLRYPRNDRGHLTLNKTLVGYLRTVQEKYALGWDTYRCLYGIKRPESCLPTATAYGPEY